MSSDADPALRYHTVFQRNDGHTTDYATLAIVIRNKFHHSSTDLYNCFNGDQLRLSIECLINIIHTRLILLTSLLYSSLKTLIYTS